MVKPTMHKLIMAKIKMVKTFIAKLTRAKLEMVELTMNKYIYLN
jgi:hypothetical protein